MQSSVVLRTLNGWEILPLCSQCILQPKLTGLQTKKLPLLIWKPSIYLSIYIWNWGSISGWVIPKTKKMVLGTSLLNTQHYKVQIKGRWSNPGTRVASFQTPRCCSYWKWNLLVALDHGRPTYCIYIYIYIYIYICIYPTPLPWAWRGIRSIVLRRVDLNLEFSFTYADCLTQGKEPSLSYYSFIAEVYKRWFQGFPKRVSAKWNVKTLSRILTRSFDSNSPNDDHYVRKTSLYMYIHV